MNAQSKQALIQKRDQFQQQVDEYNQQIAAIEAFENDHDLHVGDHLHPSFDFIRYLMDNVANASSHSISAWIGEFFVVVDEISPDEHAPSGTLIRVAPPSGGMGLLIPFELATPMRVEWLALPEWLRK